MPGSTPGQTVRPDRPAGRTAARWSLLAVLPPAILLLATRAWAASPPPGSPSPTPSPSASATGNGCQGLTGLALQYCEGKASGSGTSGTSGLGSSLDPLDTLAKGCADAASFIIDKLSHEVTATSQVDFTNTTFLRQYAVVFAASTILTLVLWLLAVAKRAVRGVPLGEALSEAVGFLWLTVLASAFTPLVLYTVVSAVDAVTSVVGQGTAGNSDVFFGGFASALNKGDIGGGPIMLIVVAMVSVLAAGVLWFELVIRAALLYVGALLGTAVYAGLVDKNMWHHVRRWAGIMIAVILVKPVVVIVLGLAGALSGTNGPTAFSAVVSGLAIIFLAIFASAMIYRFVPGFGDDVVKLRGDHKAAGSPGAAVISSPAALLRQGIRTHSSRGGAEQQSGGGEATGGGMAGGIAAHGGRGGQPPATGPTPSPPATPSAPAPRMSDRQNGGNRQ